MEVFQILDSLAVIAAAAVAIYGINSWRREMKGRKEYELAEEVLSLFYEAKDKLSAIRNPLARVGEGQSRKSNPKEKPEEKESFDRAYIVSERYQKIQGTFNKLFVLQYRFIAIFGRDKAKPFDDLSEIINDILNAAKMLGFYWAHLTQAHLARSTEKINELIENRQKYEEIIWAGFDSDPISPKVESVINEITNICEPIIRQKHRRFLKRHNNNN